MGNSFRRGRYGPYGTVWGGVRDGISMRSTGKMYMMREGPARKLDALKIIENRSCSWSSAVWLEAPDDSQTRIPLYRD